MESAHGIVSSNTPLGFFSSPTKVGVGLPDPPEEREAAEMEPLLAVVDTGVENSLFSVKVKVFLPLVITSLVMVIVDITHAVSVRPIP